MTAAIAALGLVPAAMSRALGSEVQHPIVVVIVGGRISACLPIVVVLPVMYRVWAQIAERLPARVLAPALATSRARRALIGWRDDAKAVTRTNDLNTAVCAFV